MLRKQILLDTSDHEPYTCVVSSHSPTVRRVNILMMTSRRNAQIIHSGSSSEPCNLTGFRMFLAKKRNPDACGSGDPERAVNVWRYKSVVKGKHAASRGSGVSRRDWS